MKRSHVFFLIGLFACGGAEPEQEDSFPSERVDGTSPHDSADDSDGDSRGSSAGTELGVATQALSVPSFDYGVLKAGAPEFLCTVGSRCFVPRDRKLRFKMGTNQTFAAGFTLADVFAVEVASTCDIVLNPRGWDCASTTGSSNEIVNGGAIGGTTLGKITIGNIHNDVLFVPSAVATYQQFNSCSITISRANIEADAQYQGLSTANKFMAVRNILKHQLGHCAGLPNNVTGVMRPSGLYLDNGSFTLNELADFQNYRP